jgi:hypothetical protein
MPQNGFDVVASAEGRRQAPAGPQAFYILRQDLWKATAPGQEPVSELMARNPGSGFRDYNR